MRKNWLLIGIGLLVGILAMTAVACGDDDDDGDGGDDGGGDAAALAATIAEIDGSGGTGTATLTEAADGSTEVVVDMAGLSGAHANHLHHGSCDAQGEVHVTLEVLQAGADGSVTATSTFAEPELAHFETGHYVAVHEVDGEPGIVISCGDVE